MKLAWTSIASLVFCSSCAGAGLSEQHQPATPAVSALASGDFRGADDTAKKILESDPKNPEAALVRAVTRYRRSMHQLSLDLRTLAVGGATFGLNQRYLASALTDGESELALVEADLARAAHDEAIALDLCVACWEIDWNGNGRVDERDRLLFQVEQDADGRPIPDGDPRRKPTFRFDAGDVSWARAFVAFQRAAIDIVLAYDFEDAARALADDGKAKQIRIRLAHPERVSAARELLLQGLAHSRAARAAYLAETDDEREWVPNPRQKNHPLPLPVDDALYETWSLVVGDLERLVRGEEGLAVADLQRLDEHQHHRLAKGYLDVGRMLSEPRDIVIDLDVLDHLDQRDLDSRLKSLLGASYARSMKRSPLPTRVLRMKGEVDRGKESLERKLRYLLWLN